jgi:hypothetical protein
MFKIPNIGTQAIVLYAKMLFLVVTRTSALRLHLWAHYQLSHADSLNFKVKVTKIFNRKDICSTKTVDIQLSKNKKMKSSSKLSVKI